MEINTTRSKPMYTLGEELFNAISHGLGSLLGMVGLILMLFISVPTGSAKGIISCTVYGLSLIVLYTMSTLYHALTHPTAKKVFRIFDHCTIYLLIAGTYTPFSLLTIGGTFGWCLFAFQWGLAILGIVLNAVKHEKIQNHFYDALYSDGLVHILKAFRRTGLSQRPRPALAAWRLGFYTLPV